MEEILKLWNLRTHPFSPEENPPFIHDLLDPLDPRKDARLTKFYFDLYDWENSKRLVRLIAQNQNAERFPRQNNLVDPKSLLMLLAGPDNTGRVSLRNLILHKIELQSGHKPLEVEVDLDGMDAAANVMRVATAFLDSYDLAAETKPTYEELNKVYDRERVQLNAGLRSFYSPLFQSWRRRVQANPRPPVLLITGINDYESWRVIYNSTWHLFPFIIVLTTVQRDAVTCYNLLLAERKNVALIKSRELELDLARAYLQTRIGMALNNSAVQNVNQLEPFTDAALKDLYKRGPTAKPNEPVSFDIQWLNRTFQRGLDEHIERLKKVILELGPEGLQNLEPQKKLISPTNLRDARENLNFGK
jgi:hypothetical protein